MTKLRIALFGSLVGFLNKGYLKVADDGAIRDWVALVQKRVATRGTVDTIAYVKSVRLYCSRYLCGQPLTAPDGLVLVLDDEGLPKVPVSKLFKSRDPAQVRLGFTLLSVSRHLPGRKSPDLSPITGPYKGIDLDCNIQSFVSTVSELGWKITRPQWEECHVTTKAGPNSQALVGSIEDAHILTDAQISNLRVLGGDELVQLIESVRSFSLESWTEQVGVKPKGRSARLSLVNDKEAKCRIVALLDYWTQTALKPLHEAEFRILKSLRPDCTFNQGSFRAALPPIGPYHSLDLTSATDRFPALLQKAVLATMIDEEYASAWHALLCDRDYHAPFLPLKDKLIRYAVGQPMGAYSSWPTFALCHHVAVRVAAKRAGKPVHFSAYALLGDDIVIASDAVALEYRKLMGELGVDISETKTHVSPDTYEFAKRWISSNAEVTGAPLGSLFEAVRFAKTDLAGDIVPSKTIKYVSFYEAATWFREVETRWLPRSRSLVTRSLLAELFLLLGRGSESFRLAEKAWRFFLLPSREDTRLLRAEKCDKLGSLVLGGILGCGQFKKCTQFIVTYLNECKARVLEEAIKNQMQQLSRFQLELQKFRHLVPEGLDAQSALLSLPPFAALRVSIRSLQLEFDKAREVRNSEDLQHWLHLSVRLFVDPFRVLSTRTSKTVASTKATVLNNMVAMTREIARIRSIAITDISEESLLDVINTSDVRPARGDRNRKNRVTSSKGYGESPLRVLGRSLARTPAPEVEGSPA